MRFLGKDGTEVAKVVEFIPGDARLKEVTEYDGKRKVPPPTSHLGIPMDTNPLTAADLGLRWIEALVATAKAIQEP
jgi:hypothetical protein